MLPLERDNRATISLRSSDGSFILNNLHRLPDSVTQICIDFLFLNELTPGASSPGKKSQAYSDRSDQWLMLVDGHLREKQDKSFYHTFSEKQER